MANRVQTIRDSTEPNEWHYVDSTSNPADDASRGLKISCFLERRRWINGPMFLWKPVDEWLECPIDVNTNAPDDPEIAIVSLNTAVVNQRNDMMQQFARFSQWYRLEKVVPLLLRIKPRRNLKTLRKTLKPHPIMVEDLEKAEVTILKIVQADSFPTEINALELIKECSITNERNLAKRKKMEIKKASSLYRLDPFIGPDGLLRVGGRLRKSDEIATESKHPVILPKKGHVSELIIRHAHENVAHSGRGITLNEVRSRYWIINANSAVRNYISTCVQCRKLRASKGEQKMADLPKDSLISAAPFTYCGVDYFGHCLVKEGRKELKRYGVLFTCLSSRAIHLESANSLETDSFLNALRRFIARRGPVRQIRSNQGTTLMGAAKELKEALKKMDHSKIKEYPMQIGKLNGNQTHQRHHIWVEFGNVKSAQHVPSLRH